MISSQVGAFPDTLGDSADRNQYPDVDTVLPF